MGSTINEQLDFLFEEWKKRSEEEGEAKEPGGERVIFTRDGLLLKHTAEGTEEAATAAVETAWKKAPLRIAILLKDQPSSFSDDLRYWFYDTETDNEQTKRQKQRNLQLDVSFLRRLATLVWGFVHITTEQHGSYSEITKEELLSTFESTPLAFIETKKQGGGTSITDKVLRHYLNTYGDLLQKELDILKPNIIVCTGGVIYNYVLRHIFAGKELCTVKGHNSVRYCPETGTLIFCSYHPSYWLINDETFYEGVMDHYRAFLHAQDGQEIDSFLSAF